MGHIIDAGTALQLLANSTRLGGHFEERHTKLSNQDLMARLYNGDSARNGEVQWISAFLTLGDAARAAAETLRGWGDDRYNAMINNRIAEDVIAGETVLPFRARFAFGSGVRTIETRRTKMVLRATPEGPRYMIHTFYPRPPHEWDV